MKSRVAVGRIHTRVALMPVLLATTALVAIPKAHADETIETVVVTAEKRVENIQKVPFSITALSNEKLSQLNAQNFNDYVKFLPSVTYTVGQPSGGGNGAPGFATVTMRGISSGNDGNHSGSEPTVGVYLDEEPITTIGGTLDVPTYDVSRVEALAGPQGTLYGASSEAGTIRIITNKPDPSGFSAAYDLDGNTVDHGGVGGSINGYVNVPLADNAAIRIVGWDEHDAGYIDNVPGTRTFPTSGVTLNNAAFVKNNYNTVDKMGARAALQIDLDENWTVTAGLMGENELSNGFFAFDPSVGDLKVQHFFPEFVHDNWGQASLTIQGKVGDLDLTYAGSHMDRWVHESSDYTDYGFLYDTLYPPSYFGNYFYNNSNTLIPPAQHIIGKDHFAKDSHEIRIATPSDSTIRFVGGLFYERQSHWIFQDYMINGLADSLAVPGFPDTIWLTDQIRIDRDFAAFGELSYDITPKWSVTGGIRVFEADNSMKGFFGFNSTFSSHTGVANCGSPSTFVPFRGAPCTNLKGSVVETGYTHKLTTKYQIDDDRMVYATWSTGFRPGGLNRRTSFGDYNPDKLTNYEVGLKSTWMDGALVFNADAFWEDWTNPQFSFLSTNSFTIIQNAAKADSKGFEASLTYAYDSHLTINAAGTYADAHLDSNFCGVLDATTCPNNIPFGQPGSDVLPPAALKGQQLPGSSKYKGNMTARYEFNADGFLAHVQGAFAYQSSQWSDLRDSAQDPLFPQNVQTTPDPIRALLGHQHGFATLDISVGLQDPTSNWSLELYANNVTDARGDLYRFGECSTQVCGHETYIVPTTPRLIGIRFGQKFD